MKRQPPGWSPPGRIRPVALILGLLLLGSSVGRADGQQPHRQRTTPLALTVGAAPAAALTVRSAPAAALTVVAGEPADARYLTLDVRREAWMLSVAGRFALATRVVREPVRHVPASGLDPVEIAWSFDRGALGVPDAGRGRASDHMRNASLLLPVALSLFTARSSERWRDVAVSGAVYTEALLITSTVTQLGKVLTGRPRPGAYLSAVSGSEPEGAGVFHSMPSSHASMAWTGASVAFTSHLLLRPRARWIERFGVGFLSGALASATSALRVDAGAHFPSDVLAGAGVGIASGVMVPLAHRQNGRPLPSREAWLHTLSGVAAGTVLGVLLGS